MISLILVGRPKSLHIMVQAMVPWSRESRWCYCQLESALSRLVGGRASRWIMERRDEQGIQLVRTRNYVGRQTAFYASWLLFRESGHANEFLRTFPRFDIPNRLGGLERDGQELAQKVDERLRRGGFDIGKYPGEQRRGITRRFIEADEKLEGLARHGEELQLADSLRTDWMTVMENGGWSA